MAPTLIIPSHLVHRAEQDNIGGWRNNASDDALVLEAWSEGCMVGALMIMSFVTISNMRRGVLLHKLILLEVLLTYHLKSSRDWLTVLLPALARHNARHLLLHVV